MLRSNIQNQSNLLDCTAVAAAVFAHQDHILHLNEHTTFAELPKLDNFVTPRKYLSQIFHGLVGTTSAVQYRQEAEDEVDDMFQSKNCQQLDDGHTTSNNNTKPKPNLDHNTNPQIHHPTTKSAMLRATMNNNNRHASKINNSNNSKAPSRSGSGAASNPINTENGASTAKSIPVESIRSRKANIIQTCVREFLTHRLYRRQSQQQNNLNNNNNNIASSDNKIWLGCGFLSMRHVAPVVCGIVGRILHLSACREAENAAIVVVRTLELFDSCIVSAELLSTPQETTASSGSSSLPHVLPVPAFSVSIEKALDDKQLRGISDDMSSTFHHDALRPSKQFCNVVVKIPQPPFAPPMLMMDLARALIVAAKNPGDHSSSSSLKTHFLQNPVIVDWIAKIPVPVSQHADPNNNSSSTGFDAYLETISAIAGDHHSEEVAEFVRAVAAFIIANEIRLVHSSNHKNTTQNNFGNVGKNETASNQNNTKNTFSKPSTRSGLLPATLRDAQGLQHLADLLQQPSTDALLATLQAIPTGGKLPLHSTSHHNSLLAENNNQTNRELFGSSIEQQQQQQSKLGKNNTSTGISLDASIPHYSASTIFQQHHASSSSCSSMSMATNAFQPLLKIAFLPDAIYRNILDWIVSCCNTRLAKLSCIGAGVRENTTIICGMCETRSAESLFGTVNHSMITMNLVGDIIADKWRSIHSILEKQHIFEKQQLMLRFNNIHHHHHNDGQELSNIDVNDDIQNQNSNNHNIVGTREWVSPLLLPLFHKQTSSSLQQTEQANNNNNQFLMNSASCAVRSTTQLVSKWPLAGLLLHGLVSSVAVLRKYKMGSAISHSGSSASSGTIQMRHIHATVNYTSMTTSATPAFILADDESSKRFAGISTLFGAAADDTLAAQKWRSGEHRASLEAIEKYCSCFNEIFSPAENNLEFSSRQAGENNFMDQDFLLLSLGYSSLENQNNNNNTNSAEDLLFLDSTFAQAVAVRFRMDTVTKPPQMSKMNFTAISSCQEILTAAKKAKQQQQPGKSEPSKGLLTNLHRDPYFGDDVDDVAVPSKVNTLRKTKTPSTEANSVSSSVDDANNNNNKVINNYKTSIPPLQRQSVSSERNFNHKMNDPSSTAAKSGCVPQLPRNQYNNIQKTREESIPVSEPDPAPPTPNSVPLGIDEKQRMLSRRGSKNIASAKTQDQISHQRPTDYSDWLRFSFGDFCSAFFEPVRSILESIPDLGQANDEVFVGAICTARKLKPNLDFVVVANDENGTTSGHILVTKKAVVEMAKNNHVTSTQNVTKNQEPTSTKPSLKEPIPVRYTQTGAYRNRQKQQEGHSAKSGRKSSRSRSPSVSSQSQHQQYSSPIASTSISTFGLDAFKAMRDKLTMGQDEPNRNNPNREQKNASSSTMVVSSSQPLLRPVIDFDLQHQEQNSHHRREQFQSIDDREESFDDDYDNFVSMPAKSLISRKNERRIPAVSFLDHGENVIENEQDDNCHEEDEEIPTMNFGELRKLLLGQNSATVSTSPLPLQQKFTQHQNSSQSSPPQSQQQQSNFQQRRRNLLESSASKKSKQSNVYSSAITSPTPTNNNFLASPTRSALEDEVASLLTVSEGRLKNNNNKMQLPAHLREASMDSVVLGDDYSIDIDCDEEYFENHREQMAHTTSKQTIGGGPRALNLMMSRNQNGNNNHYDNSASTSSFVFKYQDRSPEQKQQVRNPKNNNNGGFYSL